MKHDVVGVLASCQSNEFPSTRISKLGTPPSHPASCFMGVSSSFKMISNDFFHEYDRSTGQFHDKERQTFELDLWASQIPCNTMQHGATCGNMRSNGAIPHHCILSTRVTVAVRVFLLDSGLYRYQNVLCRWARASSSRLTAFPAPKFHYRAEQRKRQW